MTQHGPLRWGILGTAGIARTLIPAIRAVEGCSVRAVASRDLGRAVGFAREHDIPLSFGSYSDLLASGQVDAIYNPLPNSLHAEWTIRALEAGLPVLCEKPLALDAREARAVAEASKRTGLPAAEAFMYRFHPLYGALIQALRGGAIGEITSVAGRFTFALDDFSQLPANAALGGGSLMDVGCYPVNLMRLLLGAEPLRATAFARMRGGVDATLVGLLEFPGGVLGQLECSIESEERHGAAITGTQGAILVTRPWLPGSEGTEYLLKRAGVDEVVHVPGAQCYCLEVEDFAQAVRTGRPTRWSLEDAVANMAVIDALLRSAREGRAVEVQA
jgi:predicted dehydrogenase